MAGGGYRYGGPFCAVRGIGRDPGDPDTVNAEVVLPADTDISGYGIHPALLDAALHPLAAVLFDGGDDGAGGARLPFVFTGVVLYASAATRLLVRLTRTGPDSWGLRAVDPAGAAVISIDSVTLRPVSDTTLSA